MYDVGLPYNGIVLLFDVLC